MGCEKCKRPVGHMRDCEIVASFVDDAKEIASLRGWPDQKFTIANIASLIEKNGYPKWYRPIAERK